MANMIIMPALAWYVSNIEILKYVSLVTMTFVITTLLFIFICEKTNPKESYTNSKYNSLKNDFTCKVPCNIWNWVLTCFHKVLKVFYRRKIKPQITQTHNTANNHSRHNGNLAPINKDVNQNGTLPWKLNCILQKPQSQLQRKIAPLIRPPRA